VLTGDMFPLPVNTSRVDGPSTRPVNSASGNRALASQLWLEPRSNKTLVNRALY